MWRVRWMWKPVDAGGLGAGLECFVGGVVAKRLPAAAEPRQGRVGQAVGGPQSQQCLVAAVEFVLLDQPSGEPFECHQPSAGSVRLSTGVEQVGDPGAHGVAVQHGGAGLLGTPTQIQVNALT